LFNGLAETARHHKMAIIAPVNERRGGRLYNAAWGFNKQGDCSADSGKSIAPPQRVFGALHPAMKGRCFTWALGESA